MGRNYEGGVVQIFPTVEQRLKERIHISPEFTALVTGHGKTTAYL
jgi:hypothetical protein